MATSTTSPDSNFTPRKEFIQQKHSLNSFALLAVAQTSFIRFYSFPRSVIFSLRSLFDDRAILSGFREDEIQNLCEFTLEGKPWANTKSVTTEKILVDIITIIYHCGYTFLSTLDYGRESDDRLAMAFSKSGPSALGSRSGTPLLSCATPLHDSCVSQTPDRNKTSRIPFAISFASTTLMRVIAPPLHLTPAILQAVRGSWPRGVVSEKKVGENSFEFKLKGYKWFQQDTFATDSLRHILSLLSSLDSHSFTLLSSISLNPSRSRVKDLWIFTGPTPPPTDDLSDQGSPALSILNLVHGEIKRKPCSPPDPLYTGPQGTLPQHRSLTTEPNISAAPFTLPQHTRLISEGKNLYHRSVQQKDRFKLSADSNLLPGPSSLSDVLRKPAPKAQVPTSVINETDSRDEGFRAKLPSEVSTTNENMTGVGTTGFAQHRPFTPGLVAPLSPKSVDIGKMRPRSATPPSYGYNHLLPVPSRSKTPPLVIPRSPPLFPMSHASVPCRQEKDSMDQVQQTDPRGGPSGAPPLLGPGIFRDSAFSSNSEISYDIPIEWTGAGDVSDITGSRTEQNARAKRSEQRVSLMGSGLPSVWQPSPIEETYEGEDSIVKSQPNSVTGEGPTTPIRKVISRVLSPEVNDPDIRLRKSEAALVGVIAETMPPKPKGSSNPGSGQGWVLVNVEGMGSPTFDETSGPSRVFSHTPVAFPASKFPGRANTSQFSSSEHTTASPEAKAIVIIDAVDSNKSNSMTTQNGAVTTTPTRRRFFSLGRKNSNKVLQICDRPLSKDERGKSHPSFRNKLRLTGAPAAPRNPGKRCSID